MTYNTINDKGDFIYEGCLFEVDGKLFLYSGVVHDDEKVYGRLIYGVDNSEHCYNFNQVTQIYKPAY